MSISVEIKDGLYIKGLSTEQQESLEKDLTFDNPKYLQIKKYSRYSTTREPKYLEYFRYLKQGNDLIMRVPIGINLTPYFPIADVADHRLAKALSDFPKFLLKLRDTQKEAFKSFIKANSSPVLNGSIQLPTGKGKTILGTAIAAHFKVKTLVIVHKTDLVNGWREDIDKAFGGAADVGLIKAQSRKIGKHFTIATIQTLNNLSREELDTLYNTFGLVIQDEMHHCPASSFNLVDNFKSRYRLGLSATPERSDGLSHIMKLYFGDFAFQYDYSAMKEKEDEDILPVKVLVKQADVHFNPICTGSHGFYSFKGDVCAEKHFNSDYLCRGDEIPIKKVPYEKRPKIAYTDIDFAVTNYPAVMTQIIKDIITEYEKGHSCIVFFKQVNTLLNYEQELINLGVVEEDIGLYYGGNFNCEDVKKTAENKRKFITLATYSKATEGTNVKQWEVAFFVSSINDGKNVEQAIGRIRRTKEGGKKLKTVLVYDYRYSDCYPMYSHGYTRDKRYQLLGCEVESNLVPLKMKSNTKLGSLLFTRGFKK